MFAVERITQDEIDDVELTVNVLAISSDIAQNSERTKGEVNMLEHVFDRLQLLDATEHRIVLQIKYVFLALATNPVKYCHVSIHTHAYYFEACCFTVCSYLDKI